MFHPRLLRFLFLPVGVGLGLGVAFWVLLFGPMEALTESWALAVAQWSFWPDLFRSMFSPEMGKWGIFWVLFPLLAIFVIPITMLLVIGLSSIFTIPVIHKHLKKSYNIDPAKKGKFLSASQIVNILVSTVIYASLSVLCFLMWFIPLVGPLASFLNLTYFNYRVFIVDALSEHATDDEIKKIKSVYGRDLGLISLALTVLAIIPFGFFFYPLYGGLVHCHWGLRRLEEIRSV